MRFPQIIPRGFCLKCRGCCRFAEKHSPWSPKLLSEEKTALKKVRLKPYKDGYICSFLNQRRNTCKIYALRPFDCRLYPFLLRRQNKKAYLALDLNCPYVEKNFSSEKFKAYLKRILKFLNQPKIKKLILRNPQIIGRYTV